MERLIPIINKLQDVFNTVGSEKVGLPQIVVVGCQSSGKSSVLESIVGHDLLPRSAGICTRRPLILQLYHLDNPQEKEWGEFLHLKDKKFYDCNQISQEIIAETERLTGEGRNVSPQPINLKFFSPHVLNLTLVDLPGLTKVATEGQDPAIVQQIHDMVYNFIKVNTALILAVTPANQDLANSDSLRIAREVDPTGDRTVGVLTKVDLMDSGTNARDILENKVYSLKLGYIGVVNRSQADLNNHKSPEQARKDEKAFFENSRNYSDLADRCGTAYLEQILNRLLLEHIRKCMPTLRHKIDVLLQQKMEELEGYGSDPTASVGQTNAFVLDVITKYLDIYVKLLNGRGHETDTDEDKLVSRGGGRISRLFLDDYNKIMYSLPGLKKFDDSQFFFMMKNHAGLTVPLFTPHKAFDMVLFRAIEQLRLPSVQLVDKVADILFEIHGQVDFMELNRFNVLADQIRAVVDTCIRSCVNPAKDFVNGLIDNEQSFINTARPDFRGNQAVMAKRAQDPRSRPLPEKPAVPEPVAVCSIYGASNSSHHSSEINDLKQIGTKYFDLIRLQIIDLVPKAVVKFLIFIIFSSFFIFSK